PLAGSPYRKQKRRPCGRRFCWRTSSGISGGLGRLFRYLGPLGNLPLQLQRPRRQLAVARLEQVRVEPAARLDRTQRVRADSQADVLLEGVADQRHLVEVGQEAAPRLVVGMADGVARQDRLAGKFATP